MANPPLQSITLEDLKKARLYAPLARQQALQEAAQHLENTASDYEQMSRQVEKNSERNRLRLSAQLLRGQAKAIREKV